MIATSTAITSTWIEQPPDRDGAEDHHQQDLQAADGPPAEPVVPDRAAVAAAGGLVVMGAARRDDDGVLRVPASEEHGTTLWAPRPMHRP